MVVINLLPFVLFLGILYFTYQLGYSKGQKKKEIEILSLLPEPELLDSLIVLLSREEDPKEEDILELKSLLYEQGDTNI